MAGFTIDSLGNDVMFANNVDFSGATNPSSKITLDGQLLIGSSVAPNIRVATLTAGPGVTITNGNGSITIALSGGAAAIEKVNVQTGTSPILPSGGSITINGATVAAGTNPVRTDGTGANTFAIEVQIAQAIAATDATKIGLATFNSGDFSVDANGFVSIIGGGFTWTDVTSATQAMAIENGYITDRGAGVVYTLPATAALGSEIIIVGKLGITTITPNANQQILMSSASGTVGVTGTAVATNVGDCITLVATTSGASTIYRAVSWVGNWTLN